MNKKSVFIFRNWVLRCNKNAQSFKIKIKKARQTRIQVSIYNCTLLIEKKNKQEKFSYYNLHYKQEKKKQQKKYCILLVNSKNNNNTQNDKI